jgi:hypothetical protein
MSVGWAGAASAIGRGGSTFCVPSLSGRGVAIVTAVYPEDLLYARAASRLEEPSSECAGDRAMPDGWVGQQPPAPEFIEARTHVAWVEYLVPAS